MIRKCDLFCNPGGKVMMYMKMIEGFIILFLLLPFMIFDAAMCVIIPRPTLFWTKHQKEVAYQQLKEPKYKLHYRIGLTIYLTALVFIDFVLIYKWIYICFG